MTISEANMIIVGSKFEQNYGVQIPGSTINLKDAALVLY